MKKIFVIILFFIILYIFTSKNYKSENFTNICWSLQSSQINDILKQNSKSISNLGLSEYINDI